MMSICLLGASGSIGTQTIDVMLKNPADFTFQLVIEQERFVESLITFQK